MQTDSECNIIDYSNIPGRYTQINMKENMCTQVSFMSVHLPIFHLNVQKH